MEIVDLSQEIFSGMPVFPSLPLRIRAVAVFEEDPV
jgi:kynurenine formamidase